MSLIADALNQRSQDTSPHDEPSGSAGYSAEPQFNPLAGAREEPTKRPLHGVLLALAYAGLAAILLWQGWIWWEARADSAPPRVTGPAPIQTETAPPAATPQAQDQATAPLAPSAAETAPTAQEPNPETSVNLAAMTLPELTVPEPIKAAPQSSSPTTTESEMAQPAPEAARPEPSPTPNEQPAKKPTPTTTDRQSSAPVPPATRTLNFTSTQRTQTLTSIRDQYLAGNTAVALTRAADYLRQDDHTDARQLYARLLLRDGDAESARHIVQSGHNVAELELRAYADYQVGAYSDAVRHYSELLRRGDTTQQEWYLWLAICYDNLENVGQAATFYQRYLQQTSGQPNSLVRYARDRLQQLAG
ncbi:MAG: hypothetical protein WED11_04660 [Natronospirillum sp.]